VNKYLKSNIKKWQLRVLFIMVLVACSSPVALCSSQSQTTPTRQSSLDAFSKGDYDQAYNNFGQLLLKYPKDPLYKYYSGVCLVMLKRDPEMAATLLQQSLKGASVVKSLPADALFYLGRAQQMAGKFSEARDSYVLFTEQVGKKAAREQNVPQYIQECDAKKGIVTGSATTTAVSETVVKPEISKQVEKPVVNDAIPVTVEKKSVERTNLPSNVEPKLDEALKLQYKSDSLNQLASDQKKELDKLPDADKSAQRAEIARNEQLAASLQKSADNKYSEAQDEINPKHKNIQQKVDSMPPAEKSTVESPKIKVNKSVSANGSQADTSGKVAPLFRKAVETYSFFEVLPKGDIYPDAKIKIDPEVPAGLIYRIQIAVFRNAVAPSFFKGITPVYGFSVHGADKTNYYAGMFRRYADAKKALLDVKETGFKDAFIIALSENKPISADRAAILEKEWGNRPFVDSKSMPGTSHDTLPPTLAFRVEVARSLKPLKDDIVEGMKTMAGNRGLDIQYLSDGTIVYLIGKFITFESAAEYADLMMRNNYRGAKVVAWLGNKEVPVETARQLFNNLQ
jgi:tetratricopeptide (TPR) repeat protein